VESLKSEEWIALSAVFVAVVAAISVWQAFIARRAGAEQLKLAKRVQRKQNEPYVVVDIGPHETGSRLIVLTIHNSGPTMARDVRVQVTPELVSSHHS
jgi:type II secretory pathway pseudopilin PulG